MSRAAAISITRSKRRSHPADKTRSADKAGASPSLSAANTSQKDLIRHIKNGLAFSALESLSSITGQTLPELAAHVGIPLRTLARRKSAGKLSMEESERVVRLANLYEKAEELFNGDKVSTRRWMSQPKKALGGDSPLDYAGTELGAREVENLIGRLQHGVFA
jgi:putative toxin-antitoxin system antitoxin component (TIGR02293 family)